MNNAKSSTEAAGLYWELLRPCRRKLYNFISKTMNFSVEADDIFQNAVLRGFERFATFDRTREFSPWLFAIAHNLIRRHIKNALREIGLSDIEPLIAARAENSRDRAREVFRYAARLNARPREIFFLYYDSGFSTAEIAAITGLGEGNVRFHLHRARKAVKKILGG